MNKNNFLFILVCLIFLCNCSKEVVSDNLSKTNSVAIGTDNLYFYGCLMHPDGSSVFNLFYDVSKDQIILKQIRLSDFQELKSVQMENLNLNTGAENFFVGNNNNLFIAATDPARKSQIILKLNSNLQIIKKDTICIGNYNSRTRIVRDLGNNMVTATNLTDSIGKPFMQYRRLDENFNTIQVLDDTASIYADALRGNNMIKSTDGGFLYVCRHYGPPYYDEDILIEKRDANLNLLWRKVYANAGLDYAYNMYEFNGKLYLSVWGTQPKNGFKSEIYMQVYDKNGNLLTQKTITENDYALKQTEAFIQTEKGEFLLLAQTTYGYVKGLILKCDANLNLIDTKIFGSTRGSIKVGGIIKTKNNRCAIFYADNGFGPDGNFYRLVMRYLDGDGNFIN